MRYSSKDKKNSCEDKMKIYRNHNNDDECKCNCNCIAAPILVGPTGPTGSTGATGPTGNTGAVGPAGAVAPHSYAQPLAFTRWENAWINYFT